MKMKMEDKFGTLRARKREREKEREKNAIYSGHIRFLLFCSVLLLASILNNDYMNNNIK
jgi:hypothetical protein